MGCLIVIILFAVCVGVGFVYFNIPGAIIGALLALYICAKLNSRR